jgi:hypothetical protein
MGDNPVALDFSKALPITGTQGTPQPGVSLDFGQAQHLDPQPPESQQGTFSQSDLDNRSWWRKALDLSPAGSTPDQEKAYYLAKQKENAEFNSNAVDVPLGAAKAIPRGLIEADNAAVHGLQHLGIAKNEKDVPVPDALKSKNFSQDVGGGIEGILEFMYGEGELKAAGLGGKALNAVKTSEKFGEMARVAKFLEEHPKLASLVGNSIRTGTVGAAQTAIHGGDIGDILTAAGTGAVTSAASEGLGLLSKLAKPGAQEIAGETLQTAPAWKSAATAGKLAEANQGASQAVVGNVAKESADAITQKFGKSAPDTIRTFRDAAQAVESSAKPIFQKLDELSNGGFQTAKNELDAANKIAKRATSIEGLQGAEKAASDAQAKIDQIFKDSEGKVDPEDLKNARSAWRSKKVLEQLHTSIDKAFSVPQSAAEISGLDRTLDLSKLQGRLNASFGKIPQADLQNVLGQKGTANLLSLAKLGADPARAKTLGEIAAQIGSHLSSGGAGVLAGAAIGHAIPGGSIALGAHFLYSHPEAGQLVVRLLQKGTTPKVVVPAVLQLLKAQHEQEPAQ